MHHYTLVLETNFCQKRDRQLLVLIGNHLTMVSKYICRLTGSKHIKIMTNHVSKVNSKQNPPSKWNIMCLPLKSPNSIEERPQFSANFKQLHPRSYIQTGNFVRVDYGISYFLPLGKCNMHETYKTYMYHSS